MARWGIKLTLEEKERSDLQVTLKKNKISVATYVLQCLREKVLELKGEGK